MLNTDISPAVRRLVEVFEATPAGQVITYAQLSAAAGRDVRRDYWLIQSARKIASRDHGIVLGTERNVGLKRLTTEELPNVGSKARRHIRRTSRDAVKTISQGLRRANDVSPEVQRKTNAEITSLSLAAYIASDRAAAPPPAADPREPESVADLHRRLLDNLR